METKLTLRMNKAVIERVKLYAQAQDRSLSGLTEDLYKQLLNEEEAIDERLSTVVLKYRGILKGKRIDEREELARIVGQKHA